MKKSGHNGPPAGIDTAPDFFSQTHGERADPFFACLNRLPRDQVDRRAGRPLCQHNY